MFYRIITDAIGDASDATNASAAIAALVSALALGYARSRLSDGYFCW